MSEFKKYDEDKPALHLMPCRAEEQVGRVLTYGAQKYGADNWDKGGEDGKDRYIGAALRHINAFRQGKVLDEESGIHHLAHAAASIMFALEIDLSRKEEKMMESYGKVRAFGHRDNRNIFVGPFCIQEKIDGSQINFGVFDGELKVWSRGGPRSLEEEGGLFGPSIQHILSVRDKLTPGFTYRGEAVCGKRHNILTYGRAPKGHIVLWEVEGKDGTPARSENNIIRLASAIGVEPVRYFPIAGGVDDWPEHIEANFFGEESQLGGCPIEGVVVKRLGGGDMKAKFVSPQFKEVKPGKKASKADKNPLAFIEDYCTEARWHKAIQHLSEAGELKGANSDIGPLIREIHRDTFEECEEEIKQALFDAFRKDICAGLIKGFPEWYRRRIEE